MKKRCSIIFFALMSFISAFAHDMSRDVFSYNSKDSTCTLIHTYGTEPTRQHPVPKSIAREYGEYIKGYKFISIGDGANCLQFISSLSLPASIQYIYDYSLRDVEGVVTIPKKNDLKYIGAYGLPGEPFNTCKIYINKNCNIHPDAFISPKSYGYDYFHGIYDPAPLFGSSIEIDPENPYWGLENGILYQKGTTDVVKYLVHKNYPYNDTIFIPKRFAKIEYLGTDYGDYQRETVKIEDFSNLKSLILPYCDILNEEDLYFNSMDTIKISLSRCTIKSKKIVFPNVKEISYIKFPKIKHLTLLNVENTDDLGYLFTGSVDTLSVYVKNNLGNTLFAGASIGRLNWLNEDIPFAESMEEDKYAEQIKVLNLGNAKAVGVRGLMYTFKKRSEESILLSTPTPPEVLSMVLYEDIPRKVTLYVPAGSGEAYRNHEKWGVIPTIIEYDVNGPDPTTSGIVSAVADEAEAVVDVYNLQGVRVRKGVQRSEATQDLPQGIYIIDGEKVIVK